jgi:hypothetical protein
MNIITMFPKQSCSNVILKNISIRNEIETLTQYFFLENIARNIKKQYLCNANIF